VDVTSASGSAAGSPAAHTSPLGRYDVPRDELSDGEIHDVRLLGVPVELFLATRQQHDDLVRECAVMGLAGPSDEAHETPQLRQLIEELGVRSALTASEADEVIESASRAGVATVDLIYHVPPSVLPGADRLESLMAAADEFCQQGRMLTMPRTPAMKRFASWWLDELRRQVAGQPARPWVADVR
jgi:hypothetical protein